MNKISIEFYSFDEQDLEIEEVRAHIFSVISPYNPEVYGCSKQTNKFRYKGFSILLSFINVYVWNHTLNLVVTEAASELYSAGLLLS